MNRFFLGLAALLFLEATSLPVQACINDREVIRSEREFKSQYRQPAPIAEPASQPSPEQDSSIPLAFLGGGVLLLVGATLTVVNPRKRPSPE